MANSWLEFQNNLSDQASKLPVPKEDVGCGVSFSTKSPGSILNLPDPTQAVDAVNQFLSDTQNAIDDIGSDVMQVLQDIGAFVPPGLFSGGKTQLETTKKSATFAAVNNYNTQTSAGGNIAETVGHNDQTGDSFWQLRTSSGSGLTLDTDGSFQITTAKNPQDDPKTGRFDATVAGATIFKINEFCAIEINNDNEVISAENPSIKGAAFSIIVNGPTDIVVRNGDLKVKATDNILIEAGKSLELKGSDVKIHAGSGTGEEGKKGEAPPDEQSGMVEIKAGIFRNSSITQQNIEGATFNKVTGEKAFIMDDPQSSFSIQSAGSLEIKCGGDMVEDIGGRKLTKLMTADLTTLIASGGVPPMSLISNQSAAYYITNLSTITPALGSSNADLPPPLVEINSPITYGGGGFSVNTGAGNIILSTTTGNFAMASETGVVASVNIPYKSTNTPKILKSIKPGMYFGSGSQSLRIFSGLDLNLSLSPTPPVGIPADKYISITPKKTEIIDRSTGIYLN
jgi:hypothetical protein